MNAQELVRTIVEEVLKQLQGEPERECVMVMAAWDPRVAASVRDRLGKGVELIFWGEDSKGHTPRLHVLPNLSCTDMADLAAGRASTPLMSEILRLLLLGTGVDVLAFEYRDYSETAPGPLFAFYESCEKTLKGYGLREFKGKQPDTVRFRENLVTEEVIKETERQGASVLMVPAKAQVTPLATETAATLNITIQKCL